MRKLKLISTVVAATFFTLVSVFSMNNAFAATGNVSANPSTVYTTGLGSTTVTWSSSGCVTSQVWVKMDNNAQQLMAQGPSGTSYPSWIQGGHTYVFYLYEGTSHTNLLDSCTVYGISGSDPCDEIVGNTTVDYFFTLYNDYNGDNNWHAGVEDNGPSLGTRNATLNYNDAVIGMDGVNGMEIINSTDTIVDFTKWAWDATVHSYTYLMDGMVQLEDYEVVVSVTAVSPTQLKFTWNFNRHHMVTNEKLVIQFSGVSLCP